MTYLGGALASALFGWAVMRWLSKRRNRGRHGGRYLAAVILGPGGHACEMGEVLRALDKTKYEFAFVCGNNDDITTERILEEIRQSDEVTVVSGGVPLRRLPVPKGHGQRAIKSVVQAAYSFVISLVTLLKLQPDVIITNGPGIAVPPCYAAVLLNIAMAANMKIVYIESLCRVQDLSQTGRLLYRVAHTFIVMWPQVAAKWPRALYLGEIDRL